MFWLLSCIALMLAGCTAENMAADRLPWVSDAPILFADDFSRQTGGWRTHQDRLSYIGYEQDGFRLWVDVPNFQVWSVPGLNFANTHIYTRARQVAGPGDNLWGVLCRYQDAENYYGLVISSDGYYGIIKKQAGVSHLLGLDQMGFSEAIQRGGQANEILAICEGDQLALFVNEVGLLLVNDATFTHGDVGLIAGNLAHPGVDILFEHFIVVKP
ncbi:MAG: hypothetical protein ACNA70_01505 [Brevefilum sp.]